MHGGPGMLPVAASAFLLVLPSQGRAPGPLPIETVAFQQHSTVHLYGLGPAVNATGPDAHALGATRADGLIAPPPLVEGVHHVPMGGVGYRAVVSREFGSARAGALSALSGVFRVPQETPVPS